MINEKMLEYLMLSEILNDQLLDHRTFDRLYPRYSELRDEFIKEHTPTIPIINNPLKDDISKEE